MPSLTVQPENLVRKWMDIGVLQGCTSFLPSSEAHFPIIALF